MTSKIAVIVGLLAGCSLLLYWGGEAPAWLLKLECACVMAAALFFGLSLYSPTAPAWLRSDAVRGVACVYCGVGAMFTDPRVLISAFLIGTGCKILMRSAVETKARVTGGTLSTGSKDIILKPEGGITRR